MNLIAQETHWKDIELKDDGGGSVFYEHNGAGVSSLPTNLLNRITQLQEDGKELRQISFGQDSSWVLLYGNDGAYWSGIPETLVDKIKTKANVSQVSILGNGGYVLIYGSNGYSFDGIPDGLGDKIIELNQNGKVIRKVAVNDNHQWVVLWGKNEASWSGNAPSGLVEKIKEVSEKWIIRDVSINNSGRSAILYGDNGWWCICSEDVKVTLRKAHENILSAMESSISNTSPNDNFKEYSDATIWAELKGYSKQDIINHLIDDLEVGPIKYREDSKEFNNGGPAWTIEYRLNVKARYQNNQIIITSSYTTNTQTKTGWVPTTENYECLIDFDKLKGVSMDDIQFERKEFPDGNERSVFTSRIAAFTDGFKTYHYGKGVSIYGRKGASNPEIAKRYIWAISNL